MLPLILTANEDIIHDRSRLQALATRPRDGGTLTADELAWLRQLVTRYRVINADKVVADAQLIASPDELLSRVDSVPPGLGQGAYESGYGSSRFALTGNALPPELQQAWLSGWDSGDRNPELVDSARWRQLMANPQIRIYETGGSDALALGGNVPYGKMHAKFMLGGNFGWVGTSNLDYRSRLLNNEMGFFFTDASLRADLRADADQLKQHALLWGTPAWLQLRQQVTAAGGSKGWTTRYQRFIYKTIVALGLVWQF